jgi:hypothetical protein
MFRGEHFHSIADPYSASPHQTFQKSCILKQKSWQWSCIQVPANLLWVWNENPSVSLREDGGGGGALPWERNQLQVLLESLTASKAEHLIPVNAHTQNKFQGRQQISCQSLLPSKKFSCVARKIQTSDSSFSCLPWTRFSRSCFSLILTLPHTVVFIFMHCPVPSTSWF